MEDEKKQLKKYSLSRAGGIGIFFGIFFIVLAFIARNEISPLHVFGASVLGVVIVLGCVYSYVKYEKRFKQIEQNGEMVTLLSDFRNGSRAFEGKLIVGQQWLIGKGTGDFIKFSDIQRMYQTVHKTNYIEDSRQITAVTKDSKTHQLCFLKLRGKSDDELQNFFAYAHSRNPEIQFGYLR